MSNYDDRIDTWADGYGRWHALVPETMAGPMIAARVAIRAQGIQRMTDQGSPFLEHELNLWGSHPKAAEEIFEMFKEDAYTQAEVDAMAEAVADLGEAAQRVKDLLDRRVPTTRAREGL